MTVLYPQARIRTIARWALVLFVMAWINLVVQAPVHAAMKQDSAMPCHCDVTLCDTILSLEQQADDGLSFASMDLAGFHIAFVSITSVEPVATVADIQFQRASLDFRQYSPPPLLLKTTLLI